MARKITYPVGHSLNPKVVCVPKGMEQREIKPHETHPQWRPKW